MGKELSSEMIMARCKTDNLALIKNLNLWGNEITDVSLIRQMKNLEVLSLSVNKIATLKDFVNCLKLQELYLRKNNIEDLSEIKYLGAQKSLRILWLSENKCAEMPYYRQFVIKMLPELIKLDNKNITDEERMDANTVSAENQPPYNPTLYEYKF